MLELDTDRPLDQVVPDEGEVELIIKLRDASGAPIPRAELRVELTAPPTNPLFSTDFPHVEGSRLIASDVLAVDGRFSMRIVAPIRGAYHLQVTAKPPTGTTAFAPTSAEWRPAIRENPEKIRRLALFVIGLTLISGASGFILGRTRTTPLLRAAKLAASAAFALLAATSGLMTDTALAHGPGGGHESAGGHSASIETTVPTSSITSGDSRIAELELRLLTPAPRVGQLAELAAVARDSEGAVVPVQFQLRFRQLEHEVEVFSTVITAPDGRLAWKGQFFDGSPHRVELVASPLGGKAGEAVTATLETEVEAVAPPFSASAKAFLLLMSIAAATMALGFQLGGRTRPRLEGVT